MAIDPILIRFAVGGVQEVDRAFDSILKRIERTETSGQRFAREGADARVRTTRSEAEQRERAYQKLVKETERWEQQATKAAEREGQQRARAAEKAAAKVTSEEVKAAEKAAKEVERLEKYKLDVRRRSSEMAGRYAEQEATTEIRARERAARALGTHAKRIGSTIGGMASMAAGVMSIGGGFMLADVARHQVGVEKSAALLINSATTNGVAPPGATMADIMGKASQVSKETGVSREDLIGATRNYVAKAGADKFGDAMGNMGFFAKLSKASGTDINDITGAAGMLQAQNKNLSQKDMKQMLLDMSAQGKAGAVEISDIASLAGGLGSTRGLYQGSTTENQRKLIALSQITRTEGTSAEEAMVGVKDLGTEATKKAAGAHAPRWLRDAVDKKTGQIKGGPEQLIEAALLGTKGNLGQLTEVFGARGSKAFDRLAQLFNAAGGGQAGIAAIRKEMAPIMGARGSEANLNAEYKQTQTPGERMAKVWNALEVTVGQRLEPSLMKLADKAPQIADLFGQIIDAGGKFAEFLLDNPYAGIGAIIGGAVVKDLAGAALGTKAGAAIAAALAAMELGKLLIDSVDSADIKAQQVTLATAVEAGNEASKITAETQAGTVTPADIKEAERVKHGLEGTIAGKQDEGPGLGAKAIGFLGGAWSSGKEGGLAGGQEGVRLVEQKYAGSLKNLTDQHDRLTKSIDNARTKMDSLAGAAHDAARHLTIDQRTPGGH